MSGGIDKTITNTILVRTIGTGQTLTRDGEFKVVYRVSVNRSMGLGQRLGEPVVLKKQFIQMVELPWSKATRMAGTYLMCIVLA